LGLTSARRDEKPGRRAAPRPRRKIAGGGLEVSARSIQSSVSHQGDEKETLTFTTHDGEILEAETPEELAEKMGHYFAQNIPESASIALNALCKAPSRRPKGLRPSRNLGGRTMTTPRP